MKNIAEAREYLKDKIDADDFLESFFLGNSFPKLRYFFLIGPLASIGFKQYHVYVTKKGILFEKLPSFLSSRRFNYFKYTEIESVKVKRGFLKQGKVNFLFKNKRKLKISFVAYALKGFPVFDSKLQQYLENRMLENR